MTTLVAGGHAAMLFRLQSDYQPKGDQPQAIEKLVDFRQFLARIREKIL